MQKVAAAACSKFISELSQMLVDKDGFFDRLITEDES
jgi:hypothetical protein